MDSQVETPDKDGNVDVLGRPFDTSTCEVPLVAGILSYVGEMSELFYDVMRHNTNHEPDLDGEQDFDIRKRLYARLRIVEQGLPQRFSPSHNANPSTIFLRFAEPS